MKNLIVFGMQGAGKGTQARLIAEKFGYRIFETGAELRNLIKQDSKLAKKVRDIIQRGDLVPNEIVMEMVEDFVQESPEASPLLFDGLPRSMEQKETFDAILKRYNLSIFGVFIDITKEEAIKRLLLRKRSDDTKKAIAQRIKNYTKETLPVIEAYEEEGVLMRTDGLPSVEEVFASISGIVEENT